MAAFSARPSRRAFLVASGAACATLSSTAFLPGMARAQTAAAGRAPILRPIPKTGEMIPVIGLGTFETFDITPGEPRENVREVIRLFHEAGGRVIDTSPLYRWNGWWPRPMSTSSNWLIPAQPALPKSAC